jgi:hypothetical protein
VTSRRRLVLVCLAVGGVAVGGCGDEPTKRSAAHVFDMLHFPPTVVVIDRTDTAQGTVVEFGVVTPLEPGDIGYPDGYVSTEAPGVIGSRGPCNNDMSALTPAPSASCEQTVVGSLFGPDPADSRRRCYVYATQWTDQVVSERRAFLHAHVSVACNLSSI